MNIEKGFTPTLDDEQKLVSIQSQRGSINKILADLDRQESEIKPNHDNEDSKYYPLSAIYYLLYLNNPEGYKTFSEYYQDKKPNINTAGLNKQESEILRNMYHTQLYKVEVTDDLLKFTTTIQHLRDLYQQH